MNAERESNFGYITRGRNRNSWVGVAGKIVAASTKSILFQPNSLPDIEAWIPRSVCERGDKLQSDRELDQSINIRQWYIKELAMSKQKRGTFASSQSGNEKKQEYVTLHGDIIACSDKAVLFVSKEEPDSESWIPKSQVENGEELGTDDDIDINVAKWFVEKEDLK